MRSLNRLADLFVIVLLCLRYPKHSQNASRDVEVHIEHFGEI